MVPLGGQLIQFSAAPPTLEAVRERVAQRTGLAIGLTAAGHDHGTLYVVALPDLTVGLQRITAERMIDVTGESVEWTLFFQTCQALCDLGGTPPEGPDNVPADDPWLQPVTEAELRQRAQAARRDAQVRGALFIALHTLFAPVYLMVFVVIVLPLALLGGLYLELFGDGRVRGPR